MKKFFLLIILLLFCSNVFGQLIPWSNRANSWFNNYEKLGDELVINGDFSTTPTEWINYNIGSWSYDATNKYMVNDGNLATLLEQDGILTTGHYYKLTFDIVSLTGNQIILRYGDIIENLIDVIIGHNTIYFTAIGTYIGFKRRTNAFILDNVSIKEVLN